MNPRSRRGSTLIPLAGKWNSPGALEFPHANGADSTLRDNNESSILHWAARTDNLETLETLRKGDLRRLDVEGRDHEGQTARGIVDRRYTDGELSQYWFFAFVALLGITTESLVEEVMDDADQRHRAVSGGDEENYKPRTSDAGKGVESLSSDSKAHVSLGAAVALIIILLFAVTSLSS